MASEADDEVLPQALLGRGASEAVFDWQAQALGHRLVASHLALRNSVGGRTVAREDAL